MRRLITDELANEMCAKYLAGASLYDLAGEYSFAVTSIWHSFKKHGYKIRSPREAGPAQGRKRSGDNHPRRKSPDPIKEHSYRSRRIIDEEGQVHKRRIHVITMEQHIGRRLLPNEVVHHINGNKHDNRLENLQLMDRGEHARMEMKMIRRTRPENFIREIDPATGQFKKQVPQ